MAAEAITIKNLESKVSKLDESMGKLTESLAQFMQRQAVHDERSLHILDSMQSQKEELRELRALVLPLVGRVHTNETHIKTILKIAGVIVTSGAVGGAITKLLGL